MKMRKGSKQAKEWGRKMKALRTRKVFKAKSTNLPMAKRRRSSGFKRSRRRSSKNSMMGSKSFLKTAVTGGALCVAYEVYLSPRIPIANGLLKNGAECLAGLYLSKKKGMLGDFGKVLFIENVYSLLVTNLVPLLPAQTISTNTGGSLYF